MISKTSAEKHYASAHSRFLEPLLTNFFQRELPRFGPLLSQRLAQEVVRIFDAVCLPLSRIQPGQLLWTVVDKDTRADSKRCRFVPAVLTLVDAQDVAAWEKGTRGPLVLQQCLARLFREAYAQGGLLSVRDAAMLLHRSQPNISQARQNYEKQNQCSLPHPGNLQDMGSTITHKTLAVTKVVFEGKDPAVVAKEIHHSQKAVDHYVANYHRVKTLYELKPDADFIHRATRIAKYVVLQYIDLITKAERKKTKTKK